MTVGIRVTSSTGASRKRRGRASVRGIGISMYLVMRGEDDLFMPKSSAPERHESSDRRYQIDASQLDSPATTNATPPAPMIAPRNCGQ